MKKLVLASLFPILVLLHCSFISNRNIITVVAHTQDQLLLNNHRIRLPQLCDTLVLMIENRNDHALYPRRQGMLIEHLGFIKMTQATVSVSSHEKTNYHFYIKVQNEVARALAELRDRFSRTHFKKCYSKLAPQQKSIVDLISPNVISEAQPLRLEFLSAKPRMIFY